ncbi:MAG: tetratricopeptide repeat protein [Deltaproteobacteria bacterium]|nr:tetratricopeptide repeat protein [Deltaproteobacteria bacterium]
MDRVGPYQILHPLRRGGRGVVYRARAVDGDVLADVKTVAPDDIAGEAALRREIRALAELRHPGIARVIESDVHAKLPWYAMEALEAQPLRAWSKEVVAPEQRDDGLSPKGLTLILSLVRELCGPLSYLHGQGLVHSDLRPGNLAVRPDGSVVLVDLGLVTRFSGRSSRELLDVTGIGAGSAPYTAPEQLRGELFDARADLYALGCILYELLTGEPPFAGRNVPSVVRAHQEEAPAPPSARITGIPPEVDALVLHLLAKRPRDRVGFAVDVQRALARLTGEEGPPEAAPPYLYRPRLHGRQSLLQRVEDTLDALPSEGGKMVLVGGESGSGKTRFALEAARLAAQREMRVVVGYGEPTRGKHVAAPLHPFRGLARAEIDLCRRNPGVVSGSTLKILTAVDPRFGVLPAVQGQPEPPELLPRAAKYRLFVAALEMLHALAKQAPVMLVVDDLQWADELTLSVFSFLQHDHLRDLPVLILGTWRTDEPSHDLKDFLSSTDAMQLKLRPLDDAGVTSMVQDMLAMEPPPQQLDRFLTAHSGGNPFFVAEFLLAALSDGFLRRDPERGWSFGPPGHPGPVDDHLDLPRSARDLVARRLDRLPWNGRRIVETAAVLGREVPLDLLGPVANLNEGALLGGVATLLRLHILEESTAETLRFVHEPVREIAYERLEPRVRAAYHRAAASVLEADSRTWLQRLPELGFHWEQAGEPARARAVYLAAARTAATRHGMQEAERLYRASLRLAERPADRVAASLELGSEILWIQGRTEEARKELLVGLEAARATDNRPAQAHGLLWLGRTEHIQGNFEEAWELFGAARDLARGLGDVAVEGMATARLASVHHARGEHREARTTYEEARRLHRLAGDRRSEGETAGNLALLLHEQLGDTARALALYEEALAIHREVGHRRVEGHVLGNLALLYQRKGDLAKARTLYEQARTINREVGDRVFEGIAVSNLASLTRDEGSPEVAAFLYEEALTIHREVKNRQIEAMVLTEIGEMERLVNGNLQKAEDLLSSAEAVFQEVGDQLYQAMVHCERGHLALAKGEAAEDHLVAACAIAARIRAGLESSLGQAIAVLSRAVQGHASGAPMFRGSLVAEIPRGMRRYLRDEGLLRAR